MSTENDAYDDNIWPHPIGDAKEGGAAVDRFGAWWETQGCRIETATQEELAREVWRAATVRAQLGPKRDLLEGVL